LEFDLQKILFISLGAIVGANLRYFVAQYVSKLIPSNFPYGTLVINISASFVLGLFLIWTSERVLADPRWRLLVAVGFCGGYSTYSSYAFETFALFEAGQWAASAVNILATNILCFVAVTLGAVLARTL
jgi:CrcB protein